MVTPSHVHTFLVFWNSPADRAMMPHMSLGEGGEGQGVWQMRRDAKCRKGRGGARGWGEGLTVNSKRAG